MCVRVQGWWWGGGVTCEAHESPLPGLAPQALRVLVVDVDHVNGLQPERLAGRHHLLPGVQQLPGVRGPRGSCGDKGTRGDFFYDQHRLLTIDGEMKPLNPSGWGGS